MRALLCVPRVETPDAGQFVLFSLKLGVMSGRAFPYDMNALALGYPADDGEGRFRFLQRVPHNGKTPYEALRAMLE